MMALRRVGWKRIYYGAVPRLVRDLPAARADAALAALGRAAARWWPPCRKRAARALARARHSLDESIDTQEFVHEFAGHWGRIVGRDFLLDGLDHAELDARFEVIGRENLESLVAGEGPAIVVGCHLGAYIPALHWLCRRVERLRMVVQRPTHVGVYLSKRLDSEEGPFEQTRLLLRRGLSPDETVRRVLSARAALRAGHVLYLCGDIPWPTGQSVDWLGGRHRFVGLWAELAADGGCPVIPLFGYFAAEGRYQVEVDRPLFVEKGHAHDAVRRYVERLEGAVRSRPTQAAPYWDWPAYESRARFEETADRLATLDANKRYPVRSRRWRPLGIRLPIPHRPAA